MGLRIQSSPNLRRSEKWLSGWTGGSWSLLFFFFYLGGHIRKMGDIFFFSLLRGSGSRGREEAAQVVAGGI